jgi:hypothetical protein
MANVEIDDLVAEATLLATDELEIQKTAGGASKKTLLSTLSSFVGGDIISTGTFTPEFEDASFNVATHAEQVGDYVLIDLGDGEELVIFNARLRITSKGSMTGSIFLDGMPFTAHADANKEGGSIITLSAGWTLGTAGYSLTARMIAGLDYLKFYTWDSSGGTTETQASEMGPTVVIQMIGFYWKA